MKNLLVLLLIVIFFTSCKEEITIVTSEVNDTVETFAAQELSKYLTEIYPDYKFPVSRKSNGEKTIYLKVVEKELGVPDNKEGYLVKTEGDNAYILSKGNTGLVYGVYGLLEKLGCGFFLSDEMLSAPKEEFNFNDWNLANEPLVKDRFVFNWHNFISGCTGWDKEQWLEWIDRSQKMGYNTVMIHTYHNNPMHTYEFNGIKKEVGFINTSAKGRDWGNIPINDVRRLPGGEIFDSAEFGSEIAMVPDNQRVKVAQTIMAEVFTYALQRGVKVNFAFDIDMPLSFMKDNMIQSIAEEDKFYLSVAKTWIPRPEKPEGYKFYKAQLDGLFSAYPTLQDITFFRRGGGFFREAQLNELPQEWKDEYTSALQRYPNLKELDQKEVIGSFITAKLVLGYQKILNDMGRENINIGTGSWKHQFVVPTASFLPSEIKLMPIDWDIKVKKPMLENNEILTDFSSEECKNRVVPFIWAHHDDGEYVGRPYKPTENLNAKLKQGECEAFGVFHWMNRPLDLFFKSMSRQVWKETENESFDETCKLLARHYFGSESVENYFNEWVSNAPIFGRATQMNFFHRPSKEATFDFKATIAGCNRRIGILDAYETASLTLQQKEYLNYFKTLEQFIIDFSNTQPHLLNAEKYLDKNQLDSAQRELQIGDPSECVKTFSKLSQIVKKERGEMAYTYRFATKYIPDYLSFEQRARMKPFRINIDSIVYEDLAQGNFNIDYHVDEKGDFWEILGEKRLHGKVIKTFVQLNDQIKSLEEIFQYGIRMDTTLVIPIRPIMRAPGIKQKEAVWEGNYILKILAATENEEEVSFKINVNDKQEEFSFTNADVLTTEVHQDKTKEMKLTINVLKGNPIICGIILEPVN